MTGTKIPAEKLIQATIKHYGKTTAVACSFGKDSITVLHMALKYDPKIRAVFCNTGIEFPETIEYKKMLTELWDLNLYETRPEPGVTFWSIVKEHGLPQIRGKGKARIPKCCWYLKEKPAIKAYKELGIKHVMTGITAAESRQRALLIKRYDNKSIMSKEDAAHGMPLSCGQRYYSTSTDLWKIHPIAHWSEDDVWEYLRANDVPVNPVYTKWGGIYRRVGCLPCTGYLTWRKKLPISHPKMYRRVMDFDSQTTIPEAVTV